MTSSEEELRSFYRRYLQCCNDHRFDELGEFVADDVIGPPGGLAGYAAGLALVVEAFDDYQWTLDRLLVDGDWLAARLTGTGTHTGVFRDLAPTGRRIRTQELSMYHLADGKIIQCWGDLGSTVRDELVSNRSTRM